MSDRPGDEPGEQPQEALKKRVADQQRQAAISAMQRTVAFELDALPISFADGTLTVGLAPAKDGTVDAQITKIIHATRIAKVRHQVMSLDEIRAGLKVAYPPAMSEGDENDIRTIAQNIYNEASRRHAQDVLLEPVGIIDERGNSNGRVRFVIDSVCYLSESYPLLPAETYSRLIGFIKNSAEVKPTNSNIPGDGHLKVESEGSNIELRVAYMPMGGGGCITMRVLSNLLTLRSLDTLGMTRAQYRTFRANVHRPNAFIAISGPVGEGKTTMAYAGIKELDLWALNVCSIENPIECKIEGVKQIEIEVESIRSSQQGQMTFGDAARALMRQFPQFVFLGEIRDRETLEIANLMSTTGISLICTTHAPNALKTILRFEALGATRQQIAQTMTMAVSQRLIGKLCKACKIGMGNDLRIKERTKRMSDLFGLDLQNATLFTAKPGGCDLCNGRGYADRIGAVEILEFTPEVIEALVTGTGLKEVAYAAVEGGFRPMIVSALQHMFNGDTDEAEIERRLSYEEVAAYVRPGSMPPDVLGPDGGRI